MSEGWMARYEEAKLQRYVIDHVSGDVNVWLAVVQHVSPINKVDFKWPNDRSLRGAQDEDHNSTLKDVALDAGRGLYCFKEDTIWVLDGAVDLQQRLCVMVHTRASVHHGATASIKSLVRFGKTLRATRPNEVIHLDFLPVVELGLRILISCSDATVDQAYASLFDWFKGFGTFLQRSPIKAFTSKIRLSNDNIAHWELSTSSRLQIVLEQMAFHSECKLQITDWPHIRPVVQAALNGMSTDHLNGVMPLTAFTALPDIEKISAPFALLLTCASHAHRRSEYHRKVARDRYANTRVVMLQKFSRGPKCIITALNSDTFETQDLVEPFSTTVRPVSCLHLYREAMCGIPEDSLEHAIHGKGGHLVE
ncbi:hypothetical protein PHMEG_00010295 [Phytophthora megakarya]|uniref:Uncharacterized protein n=1 Tax=Phytophthora megakarya TaxID=4795 RepID=A0A225WEE0_9STRA|nr:hypothetical protein PHMEG_00010295 [Phytophthora megakarya]